MGREDVVEGDSPPLGPFAVLDAVAHDAGEGGDDLPWSLTLEIGRGDAKLGKKLSRARNAG